jgi:hypothetical protein
LVFWLATLAGWRISGALAAALLACSGYHVFWSKVARMFALDCFLGLAASVLLILIARSSRRRALLMTGYVILLLAGLASHVFFWGLFAAHMIWTFSSSLGRRDLPDLARAQLLALVLGSPLIAFAAYQSGNTVAELSDNVLLYVSQFLTFAFALPTANSGFFPSTVPYTGSAVFWTARGLVLLTGVVLFVRGLNQLYRSSSAARIVLPASPGGKSWAISWAAAAVISTVEIACFLYMVRKLPPEFVNSTVSITRALTILPLVFMVLAMVLDSRWAKLPSPGRWQRLVAGENGLIALLATVPLVALSILSQFRPILNQRGLLFAAPYLLLLLAIGIVTIQRRIWVAALMPMLAIACIASLRSYGTMMVDPADYAGFATAITSQIDANDLVFVRKAWYETPILYYLHKDRYHLVGRNYDRACAQNPDARVWVVMLYDSDPAKDMQSALVGYRVSKTITAPHAKAVLFEHAVERGSISRTFEN